MIWNAVEKYDNLEYIGCCWSLNECCKLEDSEHY